MPKIVIGSDQTLSTGMSLDKEALKKAKAAARTKRYRERKKDDAEFKCKERERKQVQRCKNLTKKKDGKLEEQLAHERELSKQRMQRYTECQKDQREHISNTNKKHHTQAEVEKVREYNRQKKREERSRHSSQKRRRIKEYNRNRQRLKRQQKKDDTTPSTCPAIRPSPGIRPSPVKAKRKLGLISNTLKDAAERLWNKRGEKWFTLKLH